MGTCSRCHGVADRDPCSLCADPRRDTTLLCAVENSRDVVALERTGVFKGLYHVLGGHIAPLEDTGPEQLTIQQLVERVRREGVKEIILATNPTLEGDATALYIGSALKGVPGVRLSRIATGVPSGANIEHVGRAILAEALQQRRHLEEDGAGGGGGV